MCSSSHTDLAFSNATYYIKSRFPHQLAKKSTRPIVGFTRRDLAAHNSLSLISILLVSSVPAVLKPIHVNPRIHSKHLRPSISAAAGFPQLSVDLSVSTFFCT